MPEKIYSLLGKRLRAARIKAGFRQEDIADKLGVIRTTVVNMEAGRQRIMLHHVIKISRITKQYNLLRGLELFK